jgi:hypothetical protein
LSPPIWLERSAIAFLTFSVVCSDIADVVALLARAHRAHADDVAGDRYLDRLVGALAHDLEPDLGVHRAAHLLDRLVQREALHGFVVEMGDDVVGHHAGLGRRGLVDRRHHLDEAVFHRDLDAEPAELAAGLHLHVAEALRIHVARMRIEPLQHAVDRGLDQLSVFRLLDVVGAHPLEHVAEQVELPIGVGRSGDRAGARHDEPRLRCHQRQGRARRCTEEDDGSFAHYPRTFSLSLAAHHGLGSTGVPSLRNST